MRKFGLLGTTGLRSAAILGLSALVAAPAYAAVQATTETAQPAPDGPQPEGTQLEDADQVDAGETTADAGVITVTGSRIRRPELETAAPLIATIGSEEIATRNFTNVAEALNDVPGFGVPVAESGGQSSFSVGQNFVNLFGIGSNRTLTLVNGRRFVSSNTASNFGGASSGLQVDLNVIPVSLIDRIDVLAVKGATIYGSDAIAGTVNLILKDDFEGMDVRGTLGITERGDRATVFTSATIGGNFGGGRGNVVFNAEYDQRDGLGLNSRRRTAEQLFFVAPPASANSEFSTVLIRNRRITPITRGGLPTRGGAGGAGLVQFGGFRDAGGNLVQFDPSGNLVSFDPGTPTGSVVNSIGGQGLNLGDTSQITSDIERITAYSLGHYDITDNIRAFFEFSYAQVNAVELFNQPTYQSALFGAPSSGLGVLISNPFLTPQARAVLQRPNNLGTTRNFDTNGDGIADDQRFFLQRGNLDLAGGNNESRQQLDLFRIVGGVQGDFELANRSFSWNVSYNHGRSQALSTGPNLVQANFLNAVDAVGVTAADVTRLRNSGASLNVIRNGQVIGVTGRQLQAGDIACRVGLTPPTAPGSGAPGTAAQPRSVTACVPLNLFGENRNSQEALDFINATTNSESDNQQDVINANIGGELFRLFGNPMAFNVGVERREEQQSFTPDAFLQEGLGRSVPISPVTGRFVTKEVYGEVVLPLIQPNNDFFLYNVELDASARYIDNSQAGNDTIYSVGARVAPIRDITLRGSYTSSVRAPAITELFLPAVSTFSFAQDPCDTRNIGGGPAPATRAANCAAAGITQPFTSIIQDASQRITSSGNPNLLNERSKSWTAGAVLQPRFIPGLTITADWVDIELEDAIVALNLTNVLRACFDNPSFPNAPTCSQFTRGPNGQITGATVGQSNAGLFEFAGLQASARYGFGLDRLFGGDSDYGRLNLSARYFYLDKLRTVIAGVENNDRGEIGDFKHSASATIAYELGGSTLAFTGNYLSSAVFDLDDTPTSRDILGVDDHFLLDMTFSQSVGENYTFRFTVNNVLDTDAPFPSSATTTYNSGIVGRRFLAGVTARF